jgi:hypothetical protein
MMIVEKGLVTTKLEEGFPELYSLLTLYSDHRLFKKPVPAPVIIKTLPEK